MPGHNAPGEWAAHRLPGGQGLPPRHAARRTVRLAALQVGQRAEGRSEELLERQPERFLEQRAVQRPTQPEVQVEVQVEIRVEVQVKIRRGIQVSVRRKTRRGIRGGTRLGIRSEIPGGFRSCPSAYTWNSRMSLSCRTWPRSTRWPSWPELFQSRANWRFWAKSLWR